MIASLASAVFSAFVWALRSVLSWLLSPLPLTALVISLGFLYHAMTKNYDFWPSRGMPNARTKFPWGNEYGPPFISSIHGFENWIYNVKGGKKYCGYIELTRPVLYVGDLDLIRSITVKDFEHFTNRRHLVISKEFKKMLTVLNGAEWKEARSIMSPAFSSSKLRHMHQLCINNAENLSRYMRETMSAKEEIDLKDSFGRFTMDNIASCAFGVSCNSFTDPNSEFASNAAKLFEIPKGYAAFRLLLVLIIGIDNVKWIPDPLSSNIKFFEKAVNITIGNRDAMAASRQDILQLLLNTRNKDGDRALSDDSVFAQAIMFFMVGYDTTASLLVFSAYCLATEPAIQMKVREEINEALKRLDGRLTYDAVMEMTFLDRFMSEVLRLYPPVIRQERECSKDYTIPGTDHIIPRGTVVQMPIFSIHRDPELYPEPLKFDPDRFLPEAKESRHPCAYMPFGLGPRNCIAMRFALFEAKVALIAVLRESRLEPGPNTPPPPMPLDEHTMMIAPAKGKGVLKVTAL